MAELVDGNNLIGRMGGGSRDTLVASLAELARTRQKRFTVVFDGPPKSGRAKVQTLGELTIVYAAPRSADDEILRRVKECRDPKRLTVVTDDRSLANAAAAAGARPIGVDAFRKQSAASLGRREIAVAQAKPSVPVSVKDWERWFADPKNRTHQP